MEDDTNQTKESNFTTVDDSAPLKVEDCLIQLNSKTNKFQSVVLLIFSLKYFFLGFQAGTYVFMFLAPQFFVGDPATSGNRGLSPVPVPESEACAFKNFHVEGTFTSLTTEGKLYCEASSQKNLYEFTILIFGTVISAFFILLTDRLGRKVVILTNWLLVLFGCACVFLEIHLYGKVLGLVFLWAYLDTLLASCTTLSNELLVNPFRNFSGVVFNSSNALGGILGTFLASYLGNYRFLVLVYSAGFTLTSLLLLFLVPKSPSFVLSQNRYGEFRESLQQIARHNSVSASLSQRVLEMGTTLIQSILI